jgi:hypothetical protein
MSRQDRGPTVDRLPRQVLWSSSFLQSCFYYDALMRSPLRAHALAAAPTCPEAPEGPAVRVAAVPALAQAGALSAPGGGMTTMLRTSTGGPGHGAAELRRTPGAGDRRRIGEPYRQPFGREHTLRQGRPVGWLLLTSAIEKVFFPTALLTMLLLRHWEALLVTIAFESLIGLTALVIVTKGERMRYLFKGLAVLPVRYALIASEVVTLARFATDLWITKNRKWRK